MRFLVVLSLLLVSATSYAATMYTYTGNTYSNIADYAFGDPNLVYDTSMSVSGSFTVDADLAVGWNNFTGGDTHGYAFFDGQNTLTNENSEIMSFSVFADATGNILEWSISVEWIESVPEDPAWIHQRISTENDSGTVEDSVLNYYCTPYYSGYGGEGVCAQPDVHAEAYVVEPAGTWSKSSVVPVPAAVWLFGSALAALGWVRRR